MAGIYDLDAPPQPDLPLRPEAALGAAIIRQAVFDARGGSYTNPRIVEDARAFLSGGPELAFWCEVANLPPEGVRKLAQQALPGARRGVRRAPSQQGLRREGSPEGPREGPRAPR